MRVSITVFEEGSGNRCELCGKEAAVAVQLPGEVWKPWCRDEAPIGAEAVDLLVRAAARVG